MTTRNDFNLPDCEGTFSASNREVEFVVATCGVGPFFSALWTYEKGELLFENVEAGPVVITESVGGGGWTKIS